MTEITEKGPRMTFDLTTQSWILCEMHDGSRTALSLRDVLRRAAEIRRIAGDTPAQDYAVLRVILVVFWRSVRHGERLNGSNAETGEDWWIDQYQQADAPQWIDDALRYLDEHRDRFDLLHPTQPLMQVADLRTAKGEHSSLEKLIPDSESDYFTMRAGEGLDSVDFAEAARWLVHLQAWNYSGIKGGAVGDDRVKGGKGYPIGTGWAGKTGGVVLHGRSLAETLILNTAVDKVFSDEMDQDLPVWEREPTTAAGRGAEVPAGPCDLLTWQIRRVRLFAENDRVTGVLVANGDKVELKNQFADPMTAYRYSPNQSKGGSPVHFPRTHNESRTLWRSIEPLLTRAGVADGPAETTDRQPDTVRWLHSFEDPRVVDDLPADREVNVELIGMTYGPQDATITGTFHEVLPLRLEVLYTSDPTVAHLMVSAAQTTMAAAVALGRFAGTLLQAAGGTYEFRVHSTERVLASLDEPFKRWLAEINTSDAVDEQRRRWFAQVRRQLTVQAQELVRSAGPRALIGREDADGRLVTAATAWSTLMFSLRESLDDGDPRRSESSATSPAIHPTTEPRKAAL